MKSLKGKLTKEEAIYLLKNTFTHEYMKYDGSKDSTVHIAKTLKKWEKSGFIKENPVEKAKKYYNELNQSLPQDNAIYGVPFEDLEIFMEAIKYLDEKIKLIKIEKEK